MHNFGRLIEIKKAGQEARVMICRNDEIGIQSICQLRDLVRATADTEVRAAIRVNPADPLT